MNLPPTHRLLDKYLDGTASEADARQLLAEIRESPEARRHLARLFYHEPNIVRALSAADQTSADSESAADAAPSRPARPSPSRIPWVWPAIAALAASLLVAVIVRHSYGPDSGSGHPAGRVVSMNGAVERVRNGQPARLAANDTLLAGDRIVTAPGSQVQIAAADGSVFDLDESTDITLPADPQSPAFRLPRGRVYLTIAPRTQGQRPFDIEALPGCRLTVTGTRLEVAAATSNTVVRVEEGALLAATPHATIPLSALQQLVFSPDSASLTPLPVSVHEIAPWKFSHRVADHAIVFQDGFESGLARWTPFNGEWSLQPGKGTGNSQCLAAGEVRPTDPDLKDMFIVSHFRPSHRRMEFSVVAYAPANTRNLSVGLGFLESLAPLRQVKTIPIQSGRVFITPGTWNEFRITLDGQDLSMRINGKPHSTGRICGPFRHVALFASLTTFQGRSETVRLDDFVIRKLPDDLPPVAVPATIATDPLLIFRDDFEQGMDNWLPLQCEWTLLDKQGVKGSRCISASPPPLDQEIRPACIATRFPIRPGPFEVSFDLYFDPAGEEAAARIEFFESLQPVKQVQTVLLASPPPVRLNKGWVRIRNVVQGDSYTAYVNGKQTQSFQIPAPFKYIGIILQPKTRQTPMRIDNVEIRALPDTPAPGPN